MSLIKQQSSTRTQGRKKIQLELHGRAASEISYIVHLSPFFQPAFVHRPCPTSRFCFVFAYKIINLKCQKPSFDMDACRDVWSLSKLNRWASSTSHGERVYPACILPFLPLSTSMLSVSQQAVYDSVKIHVGQNSHELNSVLAKERAGVILRINKPSSDDTGWILARKMCCAERRWEESLGAMQQNLERRVGSTEGRLVRIHSRATRRAIGGGLSLWYP